MLKESQSQELHILRKSKSWDDKRAISIASLYLDGKQISDVGPLSSLVHFIVLSLDYNQISDMSPLSDLVHLMVLDLNYNQISDLQPLALNAGMDSGDNLFVENNPLSATSCTTHIPVLESRGVYVFHDCP